MPVMLAAMLYAGGFLAQLIGNYILWDEAGGFPGDGTAPEPPSISVTDCIAAVFNPPYGVYGVLICAGLLALLVVLIMKMGWGDKGEYDRERNLIYSRNGTYGTAGFMTEKEMGGVLDLTADIRKNKGTILGLVNKKIVCVPEDSRMNKNIAVYGASGSKKTRAFCVNMILQCVSRGESLLITDPKSEIYEKTSQYLRNNGYVVKVFNLISPESSDSWNCLAEIKGEELMAQLFCDVVIKNTGSERGDHFWDNSELNLLKALVLLVEQEYPPEGKNIGEVYKLLTMKSEHDLNDIFDPLSYSHPAKAPYNIFKQASETVRSGIIIGLASRLQVFQNSLIKLITRRDEIDLELPGKQKCAYFCINSDQDSTFDFLSSLFISFVFIKCIRYADKYCEGGRLPVPVHFLGEELVNCGVIPDLSRKISVIRSRNFSMSCVFQNLAGLQNRYPDNQWQEIIGNCDVQLFLGCTDELTAKFISDRSGEASINVSSKAKQLGTWRISDYTPEYRETSGVGKRKLLTMDEVLRIPIDKALVIIRGQKVLQVDKYDYSNHPEAEKLISCKASEYKPDRSDYPDNNETDYSALKQPASKPPPKKNNQPKPKPGNNTGKTKPGQAGNPAGTNGGEPEETGSDASETGVKKKPRYTPADKNSLL